MAQTTPGPSNAPHIATEKQILERDLRYHSALNTRLDQITDRLRNLPHITAQEFQDQASTNNPQQITPQQALSDSYKSLLLSLSNLRRLINLDAHLSTALIVASRLRHTRFLNPVLNAQALPFDSRSIEIDEIIWDLEQLKARIDVDREEWIIKDAIQRIEKLRAEAVAVEAMQNANPQLEGLAMQNMDSQLEDEFASWLNWP